MPGDLGGAPPLGQQLIDDIGQCWAGVEAASVVTSTVRHCLPVRLEWSVGAVSLAVSAELSGNGGWAAIDVGCDLADAYPTLM